MIIFVTQTPVSQTLAETVGKRRINVDLSYIHLQLSHQEDFYAFAALSLDPEELQLSVKKAHNIDWDPHNVGDLFSRQVVFVGIYDGHGGSAVSQFLRQELHGLFESVNTSAIPELFAWIKELGGYFKRFKGGALAPWIQPSENPPKPDLEAHGGKVVPMTENHHADARGESIRLRRMMGSSLITDSYGESRWMGALANTRGLGDLDYKKFGVTPEPEVRTRLLSGDQWAYIVLVSDGVTSMLSDDEVVDLARDAPDPKTAADKILSFAEELGGEDNMTAIVVPLAGWGKIRGPDKTKDLREYRRKQAVGTERQRRM
ncbi:Protein phosphatase 2C 6 [Paramarasmius palmivorus]|uniref:Protein phosphatase 2C 6 n=1 Tax=Paramarasmius palmivorus TaxID=297713 RepID=A0AAW0E7F3_9AGAR